MSLKFPFYKTMTIGRGNIQAWEFQYKISPYTLTCTYILNTVIIKVLCYFIQFTRLINSEKKAQRVVIIRGCRIASMTLYLWYIWYDPMTLFFGTSKKLIAGKTVGRMYKRKRLNSKTMSAQSAQKPVMSRTYCGLCAYELYTFWVTRPV